MNQIIALEDFQLLSRRLEMLTFLLILRTNHTT